MKETRVTAYGNLVADPERRTDRRGAPFTTFRIASTPFRRLQDGSWANVATSYFSVIVFGAHAVNVGNSLRKGEPVVVTGTLEIKQWHTQERELRQDVSIQAEAISHDLSRGQTVFQKVNRGQALGDDRMTDPHVMAALEAQFTASAGAGTSDPAEDRPANVDENGEVHDLPADLSGLTGLHEWRTPMSADDGSTETPDGSSASAAVGQQVRTGLGDPETDEYDVVPEAS